MDRPLPILISAKAACKRETKNDPTSQTPYGITATEDAGAIPMLGRTGQRPLRGVIIHSQRRRVMTVPKREETAQEKPVASCARCASANVIARFWHHVCLIRRCSDSKMNMSHLADHLTQVYGPEYVESGKLNRRLEFVKTAWLIWRDELKEGKYQFSMSEAYNLAATRLNWRKKSISNAPIDRSQPSGDK